MASGNANSYDDLRQNILQSINSTFENKVNEEIKMFFGDKPIPPNIAKDVSTKFQHTFTNYLATAFDLAIGNEIMSNLSSNEEDTQKENTGVQRDQEFDYNIDSILYDIF